MIESPLIQELLAERTHKHIAKFLEGRFGSMPPDLNAPLQAIQAEEKLDGLVSFAATCRNLDEFRKRLEQYASNEPA